MRKRRPERCEKRLVYLELGAMCFPKGDNWYTRQAALLAMG